MNSQTVTKMKPSGFSFRSEVEAYKKPTGLFLGLHLGYSWDATKNLIHSHSQKLPKAPSQGEGVSENLTTTTRGRSGSKLPKGSIPGLDGSVIDRLLRKVEIIPESGCWIFMGSLNRAGYGRMGIGANSVYLAHRMTYAYFVEPLNDEVNVLHRCDIRCCCNPHHLFSGSQAENVDDMHKKGRGSKPPLHLGEKVHCAKLSADDVRAIRELLASGETGVSVAKRFGVSTSAISMIRQNKKWRHVA